MTETDKQHAVFRFDDSKSFEENCKAFLEAVNSDDPEMATILRCNWDTLIAIVHEGQREYKVRGNFNASVAYALDALVVQPVELKGDS
jgi:hypothetical protein